MNMHLSLIKISILEYNSYMQLLKVILILC